MSEDHEDEFDHFTDAQETVWTNVVAELRAGQKRSHWMWFVFPQLSGLGKSAKAQKFALADIDEASAYCRHEELGPRLFEATEAMLEWAGTMSAEDILGDVDALKFKSSMTLFERACDDEDAQVFADALEAFYEGERCALTEERL